MTDEFLDENTRSIMQQLNYQRLHDIWQIGKLGGELKAEDAQLYELMEGHMQYASIWDRLDKATQEDVMVDGVNVVLHISFHLMIENQLTENNPPATRQVLQVLKQKGLREHEAVHAIASVAAWEIHAMMKENRMFDLQRYIRALRKLPLRVQTPVKKKK